MSAPTSKPIARIPLPEAAPRMEAAVVPEPAGAQLYGGASIEEAADGYYLGCVGPNPQGFTFWAMKVDKAWANPILVFSATSSDRDTGTGVIKRVADKLYAVWVDSGDFCVDEILGFTPPPPPPSWLRRIRQAIGGHMAKEHA